MARFVQGLLRKNRFVQGTVNPVVATVSTGTAGQPIGLLLALTRTN